MNTREEEDYPSLAVGANGEAWLAYVQFHHSRDADQLRANITDIPKDFSRYAVPTGGDQIWVRKYAAGRWGDAMAVTPCGPRPLQNRRRGGRRRSRLGPLVGERRRQFRYFRPCGGCLRGKERCGISTEGADIDPVATTDASGRVWVAWQGWRNGVAAIYVAHQEGKGFSSRTKISNSHKNEWDPAIAADKTVAWRSRGIPTVNGNYDVYARTYSSNAWGHEIPIAATARYEAYPIHCLMIPGGRLWVAYEEGGRGWGKDFGAYSTSGNVTLPGAANACEGLEPDGRFVAPDVSFESSFRARRAYSA